MNEVYLLLGSNLGNRDLYLQQATGLIVQEVAPVVKKSSVYETQAWGKTNVPEYLNQVILLQTNIPAQVILKKILTIEIVLGRKRAEKWGSRTIDIDLLFYGDEIINVPGLQIPHPQLHKRRFTLTPLNEIAENYKHPVFKKTIHELINELNDDLVVKKIYF